ncbi:MAG TPA: hypothetical protein GXX46_10545 [Peptococcaceae bacterium]|nr:hypothetical protein [Peptococcaceae bacterium]
MKVPKHWKTFLGLIIITLLVITVILLKGPFYYQARSYLVMYAFSKYEAGKSILRKDNITLEIPGGISTPEKDWYPFVMVFNADEGFSRYTGRDLALTILYNFGAFDWDMSSSNYYRANSPYYNSFYGGYLVKANSGLERYGFTPEGKLDINQVMAVPEYDFKYLVLESLGCPREKLTMEVLTYDLTENVFYAGYQGWTKVDAKMLVNSPSHQFRGNRRAYIQYGYPLKQAGQEDFELMVARGRIYVRYFQEFKTTVFLYILTPDQGTLEKCDREILSKTVIR